MFLYQFGMLSYFYMNEYYFEAAVVALVIFISIVVNIAKTDVLFDPSLISSENLNLSANLLGKYLDRWRYRAHPTILSLNRSEYSHPLYVKRMAAFTEEFDDDRNKEPEAKADAPAAGDNRPLSREGKLETSNNQIANGGSGK